MYNGIGVQTARGTGTSGHVMKNIGTLKPMRYDVKKMKEKKESESMLRVADPGILYHNELRRIEIVLAEYRESLEDDEMDDSEIDVAVDSRREELKNSNFQAEAVMSTESHALTVERGLRDDRLARAFGIYSSPRSDRSRSRSPKGCRNR